MRVYGYWAMGKHWLSEDMYVWFGNVDGFACAIPIPYMAQYPQPPRVYHKGLHLCVEVREA